MRERLNAVDWASAILVIVGALNWGTIGVFQADFVTAIFGVAFARVIFTLVGLAGLYMIYALTKLYRIEQGVLAERRAD